MAWTTLCERADLTEGQGRYVEIGGSHLAVFLDAGKVFVTDNTCPHAGGSMAGGWVQDGCAVCPWHAWSFDLRTGDLRGGSGGFRLRTYPVRLLERDDGRVLVQANLPMP